MRKTWLLFAITILSVGLTLGAIACGGDDEDDGAGEDTAAPPTLEEPTATSGATEPAGTPSAEETPPAANSVNVTMFELDGSGVTGSATLTPSDSAVDVVVEIDGGLESGSHLSHVHTGTCAAQGDVDAPLSNVEADASGAGTATSNVARPITDFTDGNHYVAVHNLAGAVVTCGDIPSAE